MVRATVIAFFCLNALSHDVASFAPVVPITNTNRGKHFPSQSLTKAPRTVTTEQKAVSLPSVDTSSLTQYFLETIISSGVPAVFTIVVLAFAAKSFKSAKDASSSGPNGGLFSQSAVSQVYDDLYGNPDAQKPKLPFGPRPSNATPKNLGIPSTQYFKVTKLNDKYQSFDYSLTAATQSKAKAAAKVRSQAFDSALQRSFDSSIAEIKPAQKSDLLTVSLMQIF
jgi:hypothetical protein